MSSLLNISHYLRFRGDNSRANCCRKWRCKHVRAPVCPVIETSPCPQFNRDWVEIYLEFLSSINWTWGRSKKSDLCYSIWQFHRRQLCMGDECSATGKTLLKVNSSGTVLQFLLNDPKLRGVRKNACNLNTSLLQMSYFFSHFISLSLSRPFSIHLSNATHTYSL